jgi:hypothetical protein
MAFAIGFNAFIGHGQNPNEPHCGFNQLFANTDSLTLKRIEKFDADIKRALTERHTYTHTRGSKMTIPVVVHIVWNTPEENVSDDVVYAQIDILNKDFNAKNSDLDRVPNTFRPLIATEGISFCLATKDTNDLPTTGIIRTKTTIKNIGLTNNIFETKLGGSNNWNPDKYLNIWVAATSDYVTGIGSYPNLVPFYKSGVIIHPRYFGKNATAKFGLGRVAVHEIGHYFGLYHTWGQQNDTICATNDEVDDTPPQLYGYTGCPNFPQYSCGTSNLFMNYMDYVNDPCMILFTQGQMQRMLTTIEKYRSGLMKTETVCTMSKANSVVNSFVFPNPTSDKVTIEWAIADNTEGLKIQVVNLLGQSIMQQLIPPSTGFVKLDVQNLANGTYFYQISNNDKLLAIGKFMKN